MEQLLLRYIQGDVTSDEKEQIMYWLDEHPDHMREYAAIRKLYTAVIWNTDRPISQKHKRTVLRRISVEVVKIAAILLVAVWGTYQFAAKNTEDEMPALAQTFSIFAPIGQRVEFYLSDSTKVYLNSGSTLVFSQDYNIKNRDVTLNGEGYFDVRQNREIPFIVKTKQYDVQALGTEFNVTAYDDNLSFTTALLDGVVEVYSSQTRTNVMRLEPGQFAQSVNKKLVLSDIPDYNYFKWREGLICFDDEMVSNIFSKLELYYDVKIQTGNPSLLTHRYTGKFRVKDGVEHVLRVLQLKHTFNYVKNEESNQIIIE